MVIYEHWTPTLADSNSDAFKDLANLYLSAFTNSLATVGTGEVGSLTKITFATIRVMSFEIDNSSSFRLVQWLKFSCYSDFLENDAKKTEIISNRSRPIWRQFIMSKEKENQVKKRQMTFL